MGRNGKGISFSSKIEAVEKYLIKAKLDKAGITQSISREGRCIDNGPMEGLWVTLKCEMYYLNDFKDYESLVNTIEQYIHFYNYDRRQRVCQHFCVNSINQYIKRFHP